MLFNLFLLAIVIMLWKTRRSFAHFVIRLIPSVLLYSAAFFILIGPFALLGEHIEKEDKRETARQEYINEHGVDPCNDNSDAPEVLPGLPAPTRTFVEPEELKQYMYERLEIRKKYC